MYPGLSKIRSHGQFSPTHACMPGHGTEKVSGKASHGHWITDFIQEAVDDALQLLANGQAGVRLIYSPILCSQWHRQVPLKQLSKVLGRLRSVPHALVPFLGFMGDATKSWEGFNTNILGVTCWTSHSRLNLRTKIPMAISDS